MTIFRNLKDKNLYLIYKVSPYMYTGSWYEAVPLFPNTGKKNKDAKIENYVAVASR